MALDGGQVWKAVTALPHIRLCLHSLSSYLDCRIVSEFTQHIKAVVMLLYSLPLMVLCFNTVIQGPFHLHIVGKILKVGRSR
jgi:hypothetical protein